MARQDVAYRRLDQGVVEGEVVRPGEAEDGVDAVRREGGGDRLPPGHARLRPLGRVLNSSLR